METGSTKNGIELDLNEQGKFQKTGTNFVFLSAIFIIIIISCISVYQSYNLMNANRWVAHSYQVISTAHNSLYHLTYLESQQRGYLLFNDKNYLANVNDNVMKIKKSAKLLVNITNDNHAQQKKAVRLVGLMDERINLLNQMMQIKEKGELSTPTANDLFQKAQALSDEIRALTNEIVQVEYVLLSARNDIAIKKANIADFIFVSGQAISIIFLLIVLRLFNRELVKKLQAETKRKNIENQLRSIIEGARDMIA